MKKKIIVGSVIAIVIIAFVAINILKNSGAIGAFGGGKTFEVQVQKVQKGNISSSISASGVIEEVNKQEVYFDSALKVKKLLVEKNQKVSKGEKIIEFDLDSLLSELDKEKVNKTVQELAIQRATAGTGANNLESAQLAFDESKEDYENSKFLYEAQAISKADLNKAEKAYKDAEIALKNARLGLNSQNIDTQSQMQGLKTTLLRIADIETKLKKIEENSVSPIDGVLAEVNVEEGGFTNSTQPTFRIVNTDKLKIKADVKEFDIKQVSAGQEVVITGDAIEKSDGVTGRVSSISPVAKKSITSGEEETLIEIEVEIVKSHPVLKPGLSVTCDVITQVKTGVPIISFETLREDKDGNKSVLVVDSSGIIHERPVKLGVTADLDAEVLEGLKEGEKVITKVQPSMKEGSKAKIIGENTK